MSIANVISLMGGIALFLFGMTLMGEGLKQVAGSRMEMILYRLSGTPLRGLLLGAGVTAVIQSSCATAVMVVGFVNSGMMKVRRSVSVILGAIIGTSITGWIICLSYIEGGGSLKTLLSTATLTGVVAVVGIILRIFVKRREYRHFGDILMGFAVLMFGMSAMSAAVAGLGEAPWFLKLLTGLSNPLLGILIGAVFTALLQSASAAVGILQALSFTGVMQARQAIPLLMGIAIGAAAPVLLSAIGASADGRRAAFVYPIAGVIGVTVTGTVFYSLSAFLDFSFLSETVDPFSVAALNTFLRVAMVLLLIPLSGALNSLVTALVREPAQPQAPDGPTLRLEERFLTHPTLAIEQCRISVAEMAELARKSVEKASGLLGSFSAEDYDAVGRMEADVDVYEDRLGQYLMRLTGQELMDPQNAAVAEYLHALTDYERISDHALNLAESAAELRESQIRFSDAAKAELKVLSGAVHEILRLSVRAFDTDDVEAASSVEPLEQVIDDLCDEIKRRHVGRLQSGECAYRHGYVFNDILTNYERIADHCSNIALAVIERRDRNFESHSYVNSLKSAESPAFREAYETFAEQYRLA